MDKTKINIVAILCLLVGVVGGIIAGGALFEGKTSNDVTNNSNDTNDLNQTISKPEFNQNITYDGFYEALTTAGVSHQELISDVTVNDDITLIHSKSYEDFGKDQIKYGDKMIYFNSGTLSFNEVESTKVEGNPVGANINILQFGEYFVFYGTGHDRFVTLNIFDNNLNLVAMSLYSTKEPVVSGNSIYYEVYAPPLDDMCFQKSDGYEFNFETGQATKVFTMERTKELIC